MGPGTAASKERTEEALAGYHAAMEALSPRDALTELWSLVSDLNKFLVEREPWAKPGTPEALATLSEGARALRLVALALEPAMPASAGDGDPGPRATIPRTS